MLRKIPNKTAKSLIKELSKIIIEYPGMIKSITSDNGSEFMRADKIAEENIAYIMHIIIVHGKEETMRIITS
ncbi:hypothetical protein RN96_01570 [Fusobacterium polymorphum]|uniref:Integrase catalytic domain-containing protein n=1 Tax=Fusobacterium nucleatum subsp. polymorphum TaxID=76857 RepID=A0A2B7YLN4_FUSNP|nr:hypothetical protein RN96_01570 [Fusobacterium polymorphum]